MSFMNRTKNQLNSMSGNGPATRVINGRMYADTGKDNIYSAVPLWSAGLQNVLPGVPPLSHD